MDYLEYFGMHAEPFSHAPISRFYYSSRQHTDALKRLLHVAQANKGLALLIGDIGHGKTTLARRMLDALPESEFEAAMLVIVHAGVTPNWLLKRIASQLGVPDPAEDKLTILSQLYNRLVEIHRSGKRAVVLIDEAQMLATRELMEEFRGLLNLEVPEHKLISFVFFGLPDIEVNLRLDPPLAQRVALRYHLKSLGAEDTTAYVQHRLRLAGASPNLFPAPALAEVHKQTQGVPRVINTLCDNVLLEMFFAKEDEATAELVQRVAENLKLSVQAFAPPVVAQAVVDPPAAPGSAGEDAILLVERHTPEEEEAPGDVGFDADEIAARVANEAPAPDPQRNMPRAGSLNTPLAADQQPTTLDIEDPLAFLGDSKSDNTPTDTEPRGFAPAEAPDIEISFGDESEPPPPPIPLPESKPAAVARPPVPYETSFDDVDLKAAAPMLSSRPSAPTPAPRPVQATPPKSAPAPKPLRTSSGATIDLREIDDLLADLKKR